MAGSPMMRCSVISICAFVVGVCVFLYVDRTIVVCECALEEHELQVVEEDRLQVVEGETFSAQDEPSSEALGDRGAMQIGHQRTCADVFDDVRDANWLVRKYVDMQEHACNATTAEEWGRQRAEGVRHYRENRGPSTFLHFEKCGGSMVCSLMQRDVDSTLSAKNCNNKLNWPKQQPNRINFLEHPLLTGALPCPAQMVYWTTIRHPYRRMMSLTRNRDKEWTEFAFPSEDFRYYAENYATFMMSGDAEHQRKRRHKLTINGDDLLIAEWRWCALFGGAIRIDHDPYTDWQTLVGDVMGHETRGWEQCAFKRKDNDTGVLVSLPESTRPRRCFQEDGVPDLATLLAEEGNFDEELQKRYLERIAWNSALDVELWELMMNTNEERLSTMASSARSAS